MTCVLFCVESYWGCGQYISSLRGMSVVVWGLTFQAMSKLLPPCPGKVFYLCHLSRDWEGKTGKWAYGSWHMKVIGHLWQVWAIRVNKWTIRKFRQMIRILDCCCFILLRMFEHMFVIWKVLMSRHAACFKCFTFGSHSMTVLLAMF